MNHEMLSTTPVSDSPFLNMRFDSPPPESSPKTAKESAEAFLRPRRPLFSLFARDSSLHFEPSETSETFAFYPQQLKVELPLSWFANEKFSDGELEFANCHELSHFIDMHRNPEAHLANFDYLEKRAGELAADYSRSHPGLSTNQLKPFFYKELHTLYNSLDDIYVNNIVLDRNHSFIHGDNQASIATLYAKNGFEDPDQTSAPLHRQMAYALLRDEMVGDVYGRSIVSPEVEAKLSEKHLGKTLRELVDERLKPKRGILIDPAERYQTVRTLFEPAYVSLLNEALEDQEDRSNSDKNRSDDADNSEDQEGRSNSDENRPGDTDGSEGQNSGSFDPFGSQSSGQSHPDDLLDKGENGDDITRQILEAFAEQGQIEQMSPTERAEYDRKKRQAYFDQAHNISHDERIENEHIKDLIQKPRNQMREFWKNLIGKSIEYRESIAPHQRRGRLNIGEYVRQYPQIVSAERSGSLRESEVYDRKTRERILVDQPEVIEVSLLVDCSGSMNGEKTNIAKQAAALLMYSLKDFNDELNHTRRETHSKLRADSQVLLFGSRFIEPKPFDGRDIAANSDAHIIKTISAISPNFGSTDDATPLMDIEQNISSHDKGRIKDGKLKKIIFEITDGAPDSPTATAQAVKKLSDDGAIVVGFQIGNVNDWEKLTFSQIWQSGSDTSDIHGITVGTDISSLPGRLIDTLSHLLRNIRI